QRADGDPGVVALAAVDALHGELGRAVAVPDRVASARRGGQQHVAGYRQQRLQLRDIDVDRTARQLAFPQRVECGEGAVDAADGVGKGDADAQRAAPFVPGRLV